MQHRLVHTSLDSLMEILSAYVRGGGGWGLGGAAAPPISGSNCPPIASSCTSCMQLMQEHELSNRWLIFHVTKSMHVLSLIISTQFTKNTDSAYTITAYTAQHHDMTVWNTNQARPVVTCSKRSDKPAGLLQQFLLLTGQNLLCSWAGQLLGKMCTPSAHSPASRRLFGVCLDNSKAD